MFNGLNNAFGNPLLFVMGGGLLGLLVIAQPPPVAFWVRTLPIVLLFAAAYTWATTPLWAPRAVASLGPHYAAPDLAIPELLGAAGLLASFLAGALMGARRGAMSRVIDWLLIFGCANIAIGLVLRDYQAMLPWVLWQMRPHPRFTGTLSNANVAGAYFAMITLLGLGKIASSASFVPQDARAWREAAMRWTALLICAGACAFTASRSAATALVAGAIAIVLAEMVRRRGVSRTLLIAPLLAVGAAAILTGGFADLLLERFGLLTQGSADRVGMWRYYGSLAGQSPWLGYGPGGFPSIKLQGLADPRLAQALWTANSPHNLMLQLLLEGGIPFLLLLTAAACIGGVRMARNLRRYGMGKGRLGIVLAIAVAFACAMVDIALDVPAMTALTLFLAGMLWERPQFGIRSSSRKRTSRQRSISGT